MRALDLLALVFAIAATAAAFALLLFAIFEREPALIGPAIALVVIPWMIWALVRNRARNQGKAMFDKALAGLPGAEAAWYSGSGLALDRVGGQLLVGGRDGVRLLTLPEIASIRYVPPQAGNVSAAGMSNMGVFGLILAALAIGTATAGHVQSGLFIVPTGQKSLQVFGISKKDAEDWMARLAAAGVPAAPGQDE